MTQPVAPDLPGAATTPHMVAGREGSLAMQAFHEAARRVLARNAGLAAVAATWSAGRPFAYGIPTVRGPGLRAREIEEVADLTAGEHEAILGLVGDLALQDRADGEAQYMYAVSERGAAAGRYGPRVPSA